MRAAGNMDELRVQSGRRTAAQPLHIQRLEASLDMGPFLSYAQNLMQRPLTSSEDSDSDDGGHVERDDTVHGYASGRAGRCKRMMGVAINSTINGVFLF